MLMRSQTVENKNKSGQQMRQTKWNTIKLKQCSFEMAFILLLQSLSDDRTFLLCGR